MELASGLVLSLGGAAFLAGVVDAVVGGGGLIQIPALFAALPTAVPATLFGTNKLASIAGTAMAAHTYSRSTPIDREIVLPAALAALVSAFAGAWAISLFPPAIFRKLLPFILLLVAIYVFRRKDFGADYLPSKTGRTKLWLAVAIGTIIGFYDGFFGPGTGSFLVFLFIRSFGLDFLRASAAAKIVNVSCNFAALLWFVPTSQPIWLLAVVMAVCNIAGSIVGARIAIRGGTSFVRRVFLCVVGVLILKTGWDALRP